MKKATKLNLKINTILQILSCCRNHFLVNIQPCIIFKFHILKLLRVVDDEETFLSVQSESSVYFDFENEESTENCKICDARKCLTQFISFPKKCICKINEEEKKQYFEYIEFGKLKEWDQKYLEALDLYISAVNLTDYDLNILLKIKRLFEICEMNNNF